MDGVKNLIRRPRKENATSRASDRSLLEKLERPQSGESLQRFRAFKAFMQTQINRIG
jgi:hypothetical protein